MPPGLTCEGIACQPQHLQRGEVGEDGERQGAVQGVRVQREKGKGGEAAQGRWKGALQPVAEGEGPARATHHSSFRTPAQPHWVRTRRCD